MNNWVPIASILVSAIAAFSAYASAKASSKATTINANVQKDAAVENTRAQAETEAYARARKLDVDTIERQDAEIAEVREQNHHLNEDVKRLDADNRSLHDENRRVLEDNAILRAEIARLRQRLTRLERGIPPNSSEYIRERREDVTPPSPLELEQRTDTNPMMREAEEDGRE